ncbi:hypothetical protein R1T16_12365 [Flavobacterium sp. DG1-102-2]|uniref:hypothetical protein n=1 Tax=Flavobacterium sp. DG1-102-2 TaxID=3081663 RepID=UPI002948CB09|nr:hypothetical protein [Flavobacterium sp. DG1-102-2]MDV6169221.1 hypothetical protein [Flavobacterium sp. DG1-102-2]
MKHKSDSLGFDSEGNPIIAHEFIEDINSALLQISNNTVETLSNEQLRLKILGSNNTAI